MKILTLTAAILLSGCDSSGITIIKKPVTFDEQRKQLSLHLSRLGKMK